jgi:hypothetical protein
MWDKSICPMVIGYSGYPATVTLSKWSILAEALIERPNARKRRQALDRERIYSQSSSHSPQRLESRINFPGQGKVTSKFRKTPAAQTAIKLGLWTAIVTAQPSTTLPIWFASGLVSSQTSDRARNPV